MSSDLSIFILGATGYIGGAVALGLKEKYPSAEIVAYTRSASKSDALKAVGLIPLVGTGGAWKADSDILHDAIIKADVVVNTADADDLALTQHILGALRSSTRKDPILVHTSGTGLLMDLDHLDGAIHDGAKKQWSDDSLDDIRGIPDSAPHRNVDLELFNASKKSNLAIYILAPATIYGIAYNNPGNKVSQQIPNLIRLSVKHKQAVVGGKGTNIWNNVSIHSLTDLFLLVTEKGLKERATGTIDTSIPETRFYWVANGRHVWGDVSRALGPILQAKLKDIIHTSEVKTIDPKEVSPAIVSNSNALAVRGKKDGWKPQDGPLEKEYEKWLTQDVEAYRDGLFK